jgi:hypothetical protein
MEGPKMNSQENIINTEKKTELEYHLKGKAAADVTIARKELEDVVRRIPDAALKGLKSFRLVMLM